MIIRLISSTATDTRKTLNVFTLSERMTSMEEAAAHAQVKPAVKNDLAFELLFFAVFCITGRLLSYRIYDIGDNLASITLLVKQKSYILANFFSSAAMLIQ